MACTKNPTEVPSMITTQNTKNAPAAMNELGLAFIAAICRSPTISTTSALWRTCHFLSHAHHFSGGEWLPSFILISWILRRRTIKPSSTALPFWRQFSQSPSVFIESIRSSTAFRRVEVGLLCLKLMWRNLMEVNEGIVFFVSTFVCVAISNMCIFREFYGFIYINSVSLYLFCMSYWAVSYYLSYFYKRKK